MKTAKGIIAWIILISTVVAFWYFAFAGFRGYILVTKHLSFVKGFGIIALVVVACIWAFINLQKEDKI